MKEAEAVCRKCGETNIVGKSFNCIKCGLWNKFEDATKTKESKKKWLN